MAAGTRAVRSQVRRTLLSRWRHWRELTQRSVRAMLGTTAQRMTAVIFRWQQRALHCAWARLRRTRSEQRSDGAAAADSGVHRNGLKAMRAPGLVPRREMGAVSSSSQTVPSGSHMDSQSSVWHLGAPLALTARSPMSQTEHAFEHWAHDGAAGRVLADVAHYRKCVSRVSLRRLLLAMRRRATALAWRLWRISWWHARCNAVALARLLSFTSFPFPDRPRIVTLVACSSADTSNELSGDNERSRSVPTDARRANAKLLNDERLAIVSAQKPSSA